MSRKVIVLLIITIMLFSTSNIRISSTSKKDITVFGNVLEGVDNPYFASL